MTAGEVLRGAVVLLAKSWNPCMPLRMATDELYVRPVVCEAEHPDIYAWDVVSALMVAADGDGEAANGALCALEAQLGLGACVQRWEAEEGRTQGDVLAMVKRAAARERA